MRIKHRAQYNIIICVIHFNEEIQSKVNFTARPENSTGKNRSFRVWQIRIKSYVGNVALDKLQELTKPQFAHLQNGKEQSAASQDGCERQSRVNRLALLHMHFAFCICD